MSIISECLNESFANDLMVILKKGAEENNSKIVKFLKINVYPLWKTYMGDVYRNFTEDEMFVINFYNNLVDKK
jgi:hypothetical protein